MKGIPHWSTLAGVVALAGLTGLSFNATPALAGGGVRCQEHDQCSVQGAQHRYDDRDWDADDQRRNWDPGDEDRDRRGDGYRDSRDDRWNQGDRRVYRDGARQCQCQRSYRGNHGRRAHGFGARFVAWNQQRNGRNRGGCGH